MPWSPEDNPTPLGNPQFCRLTNSYLEYNKGANKNRKLNNLIIVEWFISGFLSYDFFLKGNQIYVIYDISKRFVYRKQQIGSVFNIFIKAFLINVFKLASLFLDFANCVELWIWSTDAVLQEDKTYANP